MTGGAEGGRGPTPKQKARTARKDRLAAALRANLRRRKEAPEPADGAQKGGGDPEARPAAAEDHGGTPSAGTAGLGPRKP